MVFSSAVFLFAFLPLTLAGYYGLPGKWRNGFLTAMSLLFYAWGEPKFVLLMIVSILMNYGFGLLVAKREDASWQGKILAWMVAANLSLFFVFKYLNFTVENLNLLFGGRIPQTHIRLPIGISFFTFQVMSYVFDVAYGRGAECTAGCLAATQEELDALDQEILCQPKRLPPEVDLEEACTYFDNAALVGDSISYFLFQWESKTNYLGDILFLARGGVSMNGFVRRSKNIYCKGKEMNLESAIAESQVERVYFLMGSNDISAKTQRPYVFDNWNTMLQRIREKSPDVELVLISNIPLYGDVHESKQEGFLEYNRLIGEYNEKLKAFAQENGCMFVDLNYYVQDHCGRMPKVYNQGSYHMNEAGCLNWMKILRHYAQYELEGGTLS